MARLLDNHYLLWLYSGENLLISLELVNPRLPAHDLQARPLKSQLFVEVRDVDELSQEGLHVDKPFHLVLMVRVHVPF